MTGMNKTKIFGTIALVCLCLGGVLLSTFPQFLRYVKGDIRAFEEVAAGELKAGELVHGVIDITDGCIASNEETKSTFGIETSKRTTALYYSIVGYDDQYMLYETGNTEQYATLDALADECERYYSDENADAEEPHSFLEFTAVVRNMPDDLSAIVQECYGNDYVQYFEQVMLVSANFKSYPVNIAIGAAGAVLGIVFLILTIVSWRKSKQFSY